MNGTRALFLLLSQKGRSPFSLSLFFFICINPKDLSSPYPPPNSAPRRRRTDPPRTVFTSSRAIAWGNHRMTNFAAHICLGLGQIRILGLCSKGLSRVFGCGNWSENKLEATSCTGTFIGLLKFIL